MFYLAIDQHSEQLTVNLRDEEGDVVLRRQVSTKPERVESFFKGLSQQCKIISVRSHRSERRL